MGRSSRPNIISVFDFKDLVLILELLESLQVYPIHVYEVHISDQRVRYQSRCCCTPVILLVTHR